MPQPFHLTNEQARRFILMWQGLTGGHKFAGKQGVLDFVRQAGCIQYDPIDVCGRNSELVLQSRVKGFTKPMLDDLLYKDRALIDYFDKNLAIILLEHWPYFERFRQGHRNYGRSRDDVAVVFEQVREAILERGPLCSADLELSGGKVNWYWSDTKLSRAALESMYFTGNLVVHHKKRNVKYYDLAERHIPSELLTAADPLPGDAEHFKWRVLRRIGAVGLLWDKPSDAWLGVDGMKSPHRHAVFEELLREGAILPVAVDGIAAPLYTPAGAAPLLEAAVTETPRPRCELIAPLDSFMWDRRLILALFGFDYKWEIYAPAARRKFGYYTLPVLFGTNFIGRIEPVRDRRTGALTVKNIWYEPGVRPSKKLLQALDSCIARFAGFNGCDRVIYG